MFFSIFSLSKKPSPLVSHLNSTHPRGSTQPPPPPVPRIPAPHLTNAQNHWYSPQEWALDCLKVHIHWAVRIYFDLPSLLHFAPTSFTGITAQRARSAWALHLPCGGPEQTSVASQRRLNETIYALERPRIRPRLSWNRTRAQLFLRFSPAPSATFSVSPGNTSLIDSWQGNQSLKV